MLRYRTIGIAVFLCMMSLSAMGADDPHAGPAMNYHRIDESLATSGHFVGNGLKELADKGLDVVIDLREESPSDQRQRLAERGIDYIHVPVSWTDPEMQDFDRFQKALSQHRDKNVLVQCAANYRASAMTYLFRTLIDGVPATEARQDLEEVWTPDRRWRKFLAEVTAAHSEP